MFNRILPRIHRFPCPDEHELAAYVDQQLIGAEREHVESHLVKCDSCLQQVGFLTKQVQPSPASVPSSLVKRAKELRAAADAKILFDWKWVSVAAGIAVTAFGLLVWRNVRPSMQENPMIVATAQRPSAPSIRDNAASAADTAVRSASPPESQPIVLSPQPDAIVRGSDFTIRWQPIPDSESYEVRIVTADGDLVWRKRVRGNSVNPPKQTLQPGSKYFVWVRAWLAKGKSQQSQAIGFIGG